MAHESDPEQELEGLIEKIEQEREKRRNLAPQRSEVDGKAQTTQKCQNMTQTFEVRTYGGFTLLKASKQIILGGFDGSNSLFKSPMNQTAKPLPIKEACKHIVVPQRLVIEKMEYLAISCDRCQYIKLGKEGGEFDTIFKGVSVKKMCTGEKDTIYAMIFGTDIVLELQCSVQRIEKDTTREIRTGTRNPDGLCFVPSKPEQPQLLVVSDHHAGKVVAVDIKKSSTTVTLTNPSEPSTSSLRLKSEGDHEIVWTLSGPVDGKRMYPRGLLYCGASGFVLVADGERCRVLVLDPHNGSHLQTLKMPEIGLSVVFDLDQFEDELFVTYREYPGYIDADAKSDEKLPVRIVKMSMPKPTETPNSQVVNMKLLSFEDLYLQKVFGWTVMRETDQLVVSGMRDGVRSVFVFSRNWGGGLFDTIFTALCCHQVDDLLCLQVTGYEYLAIACWDCKHIKLINMAQSEKSIVAFMGEKVKKMCKGKNNRIFVSVISSEGRVLELDCSTKSFEVVRAISFDIDIKGLCYLPKHDFIVACGRRGDRSIIRAKPGNDKEKEEVVEDENIDARSMIFLPRQNRLLVANGEKGHILVLTESLKQIEIKNLPVANIGEIRGMILSHGQIVMRHGLGNTNKIAYIQVN